MGTLPHEGEELTQKGSSVFLSKLNYLLCFSNVGCLKKKKKPKFSSQSISLSETILCYSLKKALLFYFQTAEKC